MFSCLQLPGGSVDPSMRPLTLLRGTECVGEDLHSYLLGVITIINYNSLKPYNLPLLEKTRPSFRDQIAVGKKPSPSTRLIKHSLLSCC